MANTFKVEKKLLLKSVSAVIEGVGPEREDWHVVVFRDGCLQSYKGSISVSYPLPSPLNMACAVAGRQLYASLKQMHDEIEIEDGPNLTITDGRSTVRLIKQGTHKVLKELAGIDLNGEWIPIKQEFMTGLEVIAGSELSDKKSTILVLDDMLETGDSFRLTKYCQNAIQGKFTIDVKCVRSLLTLSREYTDFMKQGSGGVGWVHFRMGSGLVVSLRQGIAERFPEKAINKVFEDFAAGSIQEGEFPESLLKAIERVSVMSGPDEGFVLSVVLEKVGSGLKVSASNPCGSMEELVPWTENCPIPEGTMIKTSPVVLKRILPLTRRFEFNNSGHLLFRTENMYHMVGTIKRDKNGNSSPS